MRRDFRVRLDDILGAISNIEEYIERLAFEDFKWDRKTQDAVIRNLGIIGEAANHLPDNIKDTCKDRIEWEKIRSFRNIVIHEYFSVTLEIIWSVVKNNLPILKDSCEHMLEKYGNEPFMNDNV
jgi:uncharacterized protein with HEPN domain